MKYLLLVIFISVVDARFVRYKPLECVQQDNHRVCNASLNGDYLVPTFLGNVSFYIDTPHKIFSKDGKLLAFYTDEKLIISDEEWDFKTWEKHINKK